MDVDWAGNARDRRSTFGYVFSFGSFAVTRSSKKQLIVELSSIEAEYRGAIVTTSEAICLKHLSKDLQVEVSDPVVIYIENLSNI